MIVYKYFRWNKYTKRLFTDNELYFGRSSEYNDPFEFAAKLQFNGDQIIRYIKRMPKWKQQAMMYLLKQAKSPADWFIDYYETQVKSSGMCCFTESFDNILMWAHYADNHQGICVAFDTDLMEDQDTHFYKMKYQKTLPIITMPWSERKQIRHETTKYYDWKYEREVRAVRQFNKEDVSNEERIWHINKNAIVGLFLGCRMKRWKSDAIRKLFDANNYHVPVALMEMSKESINYKLSPRYLRK